LNLLNLLGLGRREPPIKKPATMAAAEIRKIMMALAGNFLGSTCELELVGR
jgi:hypothetical protein